MNYTEYKDYIKNMTREELIKECLSLKASYDKSCRSWSYTEELRQTAVNHFDELRLIIDKEYEELRTQRMQLVNKYNNILKEKQDYYEELDKNYREQMKEN